MSIEFRCRPLHPVAVRRTPPKGDLRTTAPVFDLTEVSWIYFFADDPSRKHDSAMCETVRDGKVTGVVSEKGGKKTIKVSKIEFGK